MSVRSLSDPRHPHSDSTWPDTVNLANKWLGDLPEDVQRKITVGNASRVYGFTPAPIPG